MLESIIELDQYLFHFINSDLHNAFLDQVMPIWRAKSTWIPLYILIIAFAIYKFKTKALVFLLFAIATVGISDTLSSRIIKHTVKRTRPCNNEVVKQDMKLLVHCGSGYSFTSSHATNHFAIAIFLIITLGTLFSWIKWPLILWAGSIAVGQVYVGVHYPFDVLSGSILGIFIGILTGVLYWKKVGGNGISV